MNMLRLLISSSAISVAAGLALPAAAQTTDAPMVEEAEAPGSEASDIIVTGSRIARRDFASESPITTVSNEFLKQSGAPTLEGALNQLPQFTASAGAGTGGAGNQNRAGQASASLRGLGPQRTLVLRDGRRMQPSNADGTVDLNTLPAFLIENVEVITGGASAAYGSDAVAGVVNFKTKRSLSGLLADAQIGITERGDGRNLDLSLGLGGSFNDDRGNAMIAIGYAERQPVFTPTRSFFRSSKVTTALPQGVLQVQAANLPSQAVVNSIFAGYGVTGNIPRAGDIGFNRDGTLFSRGNPIANFRDDPIHIYNDGRTLGYSTGDFGYLQLPLTRYNLFAKADYEVADRIEVYAEGIFTDYSATFGIAAPVLGGSSGLQAPIPVTNPFIPADMARLLASRPNPTAPFYLTKRLDDAGLRQERDKYQVWQITGGVRGTGGPITWDVYGSHGSTRANITSFGYPLLAAVSTLLAAPDGGRSICEGGFNPFGSQPLSAACKTYLQRVITNTTEVKQTIVEGSVQGKLFELPYGEVRFAAGADYRRNSFSFQPDSLAQDNSLVNYAPVKPTNGQTTVKEVYAELLVPLLADLPLIKRLEVSAAYRYSHYNTVGGVSTYKGDVNWHIFEPLRVRGGYSRAVRAPNIGELYQAPTQSSQNLGTVGPIGQGDPCDIRGGYRAGTNANAANVRALCLAQGIPTNLIDTYIDTNAQATFVAGGNLALKEETADTYSIGAVLTSPFKTPLLSNFTLSVDYYSISLKGAVGAVTPQVAVNKCFNADGSNPSYDPANLYCTLINRRPESGLIGVISVPLLNLGGYKTSGVDVQADWSISLDDLGIADGGRLRMNAVVSYLDTFKIRNLPGSPFQDYAGTILNTQVDPLSSARPKWKWVAGIGYERGGGAINFRWRYIDSMTNAGNVGNTGTAPGVRSINYFDLDGRVEVNDAITFRAGVINLFDKQPPQVSTAVGNTDYATYDLTGRRFYVGIGAKF